jgi:ribosomal protein L24E
LHECDLEIPIKGETELGFCDRAISCGSGLMRIKSNGRGLLLIESRSQAMYARTKPVRSIC